MYIHMKKRKNNNDGLKVDGGWIYMEHLEYDGPVHGDVKVCRGKITQMGGSSGIPIKINKKWNMEIYRVVNLRVKKYVVVFLESRED